MFNDSSDMQQQFPETILHHKYVEKTRGLPCVLDVTVNKWYDIIANISIDDGLYNGVYCCIKYIQCENSKSYHQLYGYNMVTKIQTLVNDRDKIWVHTCAAQKESVFDTHMCNKMQISYEKPMNSRNTISTTMCCCKDNACITECNISERHCWYENSTVTFQPPEGTYALCGIRWSDFTKCSIYICKLDSEKTQMSHKVTECLPHVCKHNTVVLSYIPVYTLP